MSTETTPLKRKPGRPLGSRNRVRPHPPPVQPIAMRIPDAAKAIGVSVSYMKELIAKQRVRSTSLGKIRLVIAASLYDPLGEGER